MRARGVAGVLCLVDADFDEFRGVCVVSEDTLVTDEHDLETMMIRSESFERVLIEMASGPKIETLRNRGISVQEMLVSACAPIGAARLYSIISEENITFRELDYDFICRDQIISDIEHLVSEIYNKSGRPHAPKLEMTQFILSWLEEAADQWRVCCGHDLSSVLGIALQKAIGNENPKTVARAQIEMKLRLAYSDLEFKSTNLFSGIRAWEDRNAGFQILREDL